MAGAQARQRRGFPARAWTRRRAAGLMAMPLAAADDRSSGALSRAAAARVVHAVIDGGRGFEPALAGARAALPARAHPELQAWAYGALRWWARIERPLATPQTRPVADLDRLPAALLAGA